MSIQALGSLRELSLQWQDPVKMLLGFAKNLSFDLHIIRGKTNMVRRVACDKDRLQITQATSEDLTKWQYGPNSFVDAPVKVLWTRDLGNHNDFDPSTNYKVVFLAFDKKLKELSGCYKCYKYIGQYHESPYLLEAL
ncbi:unnamed protein product [Symbiodinium sp. CCMP2592]|nr:unnamed protein product [Symbiodinium sp. CCMP2592]